MQEVIRSIKETLLRYGEVYLPDFGLLKTEYQAARIYAAMHKICPPSAKVIFIPQAEGNTQLIIDTLTRQADITEQSARELLKNLVTTIKIELGTSKKFLIPELGVFRLQYDDHIDFEQDEESNYWADAFGLPEIFGQVVERSEAEIQALEDQINKAAAYPTIPAEVADNSSSPTISKKTFSWGSLAIVASLFVVALFASYVLFVDPSANPFHALFSSNSKTPEDIPLPEDSLQNYIASSNDEVQANPLEIDTEDSLPEQTEENNLTENTTTVVDGASSWSYNTPNTRSTTEPAPVKSPPSPTPAPPNQVEYNKATEYYTIKERQNQYFVIVASFTNSALAYKEAEKYLRGGYPQTRIIAADNRYRVAVASTDKQSEIDSLLMRLRQQLQREDIWILKY